MATKMNEDQKKKMIEKIRSLVQEGVRPQDIADKFGIAVSSVHNYKSKFKEDGMIIPPTRGRRPIDNQKTIVVEESGNGLGSSEIVGVISRHENYKFIVDGMTVEIDSAAKAVKITKEAIKVDF